MISQRWISTYEQLKDIIAINSSMFSIPIEIICGIISQESSWKTNATRYEKEFQKKYIDTKYSNFSEKWRRDMATSWGLMQVMGIVALELGFKGEPILLLNPKFGIEWGCRKLASLMRKYKSSLKDVIASYNAGSPRRDKNGNYVNQYYVNKVLEYAKEFSDVIKKSKEAIK